MAGREHLGAELACGRQEIAELDRLVALDARHGRLARHIAFGEAVDDRFLEAALVVEHVMGNPDPLRDRARVIDVLPGAASALAVARSTVVVELQRHADDIEALGLEQGRRHRGIDAAGHGDDDAGIARGAFKIEAVEHCDFPARTFLDLIIGIGSRRRTRAARYASACRAAYKAGATRPWPTHLGP